MEEDLNKEIDFHIEYIWTRISTEIYNVIKRDKLCCIKISKSFNKDEEVFCIYVANGILYADQSQVSTYEVIANFVKSGIGLPSEFNYNCKYVILSIEEYKQEV